MSVITTHVLDTVLGRPAAAVGVRLERFDEDSWLTIAESATDADGRCRNLDAERPARLVPVDLYDRNLLEGPGTFQHLPGNLYYFPMR